MEEIVPLIIIGVIVLVSQIAKRAAESSKRSSGRRPSPPSRPLTSDRGEGSGAGRGTGSPAADLDTFFQEMKRRRQTTAERPAPSRPQPSQRPVRAAPRPAARVQPRPVRATRPAPAPPPAPVSDARRKRMEALRAAMESKKRRPSRATPEAAPPEAVPVAAAVAAGPVALGRFSREDLRRAIVLREVLGPPRATAPYKGGEYQSFGN